VRPASDRQSIGRARIEKGALLFFGGGIGVHACNIADVTDRGARLRIHDLALLPTYFELTSDNFRSIRRYRLIWRDGDHLGVMFEGCL
jgi:hypothetical protein